MTNNEIEKSQDEVLDNQLNNKPWLWKKGQSGNPKGRPKGKTVKEWAKEYLSKLNDKEKDAFLDGLPKEVVWKMAEGNPTNDDSLKVSGSLDLGSLFDKSKDDK